MSIIFCLLFSFSPSEIRCAHLSPHNPITDSWLIAPCQVLRIPESENLCLWNPESGNFFFSDFCYWNPESWALESVSQLELSGILQTIAIWNPNPLTKNPEFHCLESGNHSDHSVESRTVLGWVGLPRMGSWPRYIWSIDPWDEGALVSVFNYSVEPSISDQNAKISRWSQFSE